MNAKVARAARMDDLPGPQAVGDSLDPVPMKEKQMLAQHTVLLVGGTGRTGGRVLTQLLDRGIPVRAIVRSTVRLPRGVAGNPLLAVIEADLLSQPTEGLRRHLEGCDTVISCLGHTISLKGVFGPPFNLVTSAVSNLCLAVEAMRPAVPIRFVLMSTVSVHQPGRADTRRGAGERLFLWALRSLVPPARDNQRAADLLAREGAGNRAVEWVIVRPDTLLEGTIAAYTLSDNLVSSIFHPDATNMANVAHFMCELVTDVGTWERWKTKMPVIVNARTPGA